MRAHRVSGPRRVRGFALIELFVGIMVLMTALSIALVACNQSVTNRRAHERREAAREAVLLSLERVRAMNAAKLPPPGGTLDLGIPPHLKNALPDATCVLTLAAGASPELVSVRVDVAASRPGMSESGTVTLRLDVSPAAVPEQKP